MKLRNSVLLAAGLATAAMTPAVQAAWTVAPALEVETSVDDNVRLARDDEESGVVSRASAELRAANVTEVSRITGIAGVSYVTYSGVGSLDDQDVQYVSLRARRDLEKGRLGMNVSGRRDVLLRQLAPVSDVLGTGGDGSDGEEGGQPDIVTIDPDLDAVLTDDDIDISATEEQVRRSQFRVAPYAQYRFTELTSGRLEYRYFERRFDRDGETVGLRDSQTQELAGTVRHRFSPRTAASLSIGAANFQVDQPGGADAEADSYLAAVEIETQLSPQAGIAVRLGGTRTETEVGNDTYMVYGFRAYRRAPTSQLSASVERSTRPSPFGNVVEADRLSVRYQRVLSERLEAGVEAYGYSTTQVGSLTIENDRDYLQIQPQVTWRMSPVWNLRFAYRYRWVDREETLGGRADGNALILSLSYQPLSPF